MDAAMEKKLREMIDRQEIWSVMQRYGRALDRNDRELARTCYFPDAIDDHFSFVGHVEDFLDYALKASMNFVSQHHGVMNHSCELDGDNAYCETYYLFTGFLATPPHLMSMGRYVDHFQKRNGEWRIANRVTIVEGNFELSQSKMGVGQPTSYPPDQAQPVTRDRTDISYHRPPRPRAPRPRQVHK